MNTLTRRNFIKLSALAASTLLSPISLRSESNITPYNGPLFLFVQAGGGWDTTMLCDPKKNLHPKYNTVVSNLVPPEKIKMAGNIPFAAINNNFEYFFNTYGQNLVVVNGVDTQNNSHAAGPIYALTGRLSEGYPVLGGLLAGIYNPTSPVGFIANGAYDVSNDLVSPARVGGADVLLRISKYSFSNPLRNERFVPDSSRTRIEAAKKARIQRLINKQSDKGIQDSIKGFAQASAGSEELIKMIEYLDSGLDIEAENLERIAEGRPEITLSQKHLYTQMHSALAAFKAGLCVSAQSTTNLGFDSHGNHDTLQLTAMENLVVSLELLIKDSELMKINEDKDGNIIEGKEIILIVSSEFARPPFYNEGRGKDHWPISSFMFYSKLINGNRVIGATDDSLYAKKINPNTLELDENGITLTPAHMHKALRKFAGIDEHYLVKEYYPLDVEPLGLF